MTDSHRIISDQSLTLGEKVEALQNAGLCPIHLIPLEAGICPKAPECGDDPDLD